jgi:hypothetical protein
MRFLEPINEEIDESLFDAELAKPDMHGALHASDMRGNTPLILATEQNNLRAVQMLLRKGSFIDAQNGEGNTCLHIASANAFEDIVSELLEHGADVMLRNLRGESFQSEFGKRCRAFASLAVVIVSIFLHASLILGPHSLCSTRCGGRLRAAMLCRSQE